MREVKEREIRRRTVGNWKREGRDKAGKKNGKRQATNNGGKEKERKVSKEERKMSLEILQYTKYKIKYDVKEERRNNEYNKNMEAK